MLVHMLAMGMWYAWRSAKAGNYAASGLGSQSNSWLARLYVYLPETRKLRMGSNRGDSP